MNKKTGRNDPCPCGSGLKYKKCHGKIEQTSTDQFLDLPLDQGLIVKDYTGENVETMTLGSPGALISHFVQVVGTTKNLNENPGLYYIVLNVDIPTLLPLIDDEQYTINFEEEQYIFFHKTKKRGEEFYSTLDSTKLPFFSTIQIQGRSFDDSVPQPEMSPKSYRLILHILNMINEFSGSKYSLSLEKEPRLSYHMLYFEEGVFPNGNPFAKATYPYSGLIEIKGPESKKNIDDSALKTFLSERFKVQTYSLKEIVPGIIGKSFEDKVFLSAHDFSFYCSQHPKSLSKLDEEEIRDLYLVVLKNVFTFAEGEAYNYNGRLDYKITHKTNKYQFISGEFKIWGGEQSIIEAFDQVARIHNSGQENELYIIMINKNKNLPSVRKKIKESIEKEPEYIQLLEEKRIPNGSFQSFDRYLLEIRSRKVPLTIGLVDLYS